MIDPGGICKCGKSSFSEIEPNCIVCNYCGVIYRMLGLPDPNNKEQKLEVIRDVEMSFSKEIPEASKEEITQMVVVWNQLNPKVNNSFELFCNTGNITVRVNRSSILEDKKFFIYSPKKVKK